MGVPVASTAGWLRIRGQLLSLSAASTSYAGREKDTVRRNKDKLRAFARYPIRLAIFFFGEANCSGNTNNSRILSIVNFRSALDFEACRRIAELRMARLQEVLADEGDLELGAGTPGEPHVQRGVRGNDRKRKLADVSPGGGNRCIALIEL